MVEKILNHQSGTVRGVAAIYNRHQYLDERRAALDLWGDTVAAAVEAAEAKDEAEAQAA